MIEFTITVKGEESTLSTKHLDYDKILILSHDDEYLKGLVETQIKEFNQPVESVVVKAKMVW